MTLDETKLFDRTSVEARDTSLLSRHVGLQFVKPYYMKRTYDVAIVRDLAN